jgi:glycosyltransferase involved in cell wall biosynthesis
MMAQESSELEFFLIDNGSPDRCGEICAEYAKKDRRFKIFTIAENVGYIKARNIGIHEVDADYIGFCDSDDYLEPKGYDRAIEKIRETDCDLYLAAFRTVSENKKFENYLPYKTGLYVGDKVQEIIRPQTFGRLPGRGVLHGFAWKQIVRRSIITENGFFFMEELKPYEDQLFNTDIIGECESVYVDDSFIYNYVVNETSITAQLRSDFDPMAESSRILRLYSEKKKRVKLNLDIEANCNESLEMIYECILTMVKQKFSIIKVAKQIRCFFGNNDTREIIHGTSKNVSLNCQVCSICLRLRLYGVLVWVIRIARRIKGD